MQKITQRFPHSFETVAILSNVVGASCKHRDILREKQVENIIQGICLGEILIGRGLNQETTVMPVIFMKG